MIKKIKCEICGKEFEHELTKDGIIPNVLTMQFIKHLSEEHNISLEKYVIDTFHNGIHPVCACGCGKELPFIKKGALYRDNHGFNKYYSCTHVIRNEESINKTSATIIKNYSSKEWLAEYYERNYGLENIKNAFAEFYNEKSLRNISDKYKIDKRVLKKAWITLGLISPEDYVKQAKLNQANSNSLEEHEFKENEESICKELYSILKSSPQKYNINSLKRFYNKHHTYQINLSPERLYRILFDIYEEEIDYLLSYGYHSTEEYTFFQVLIFYFGYTHVKMGKRLSKPKAKTKKDVYIYDYCLFGQLIIEYDGEGVYHLSDEQCLKDKEKETFAVQKGYKFLRLSKQDIKDPELIVRIKNILNND